MKNTKEALRTSIISALFIMILVAVSLILMKLTDNLTNSSADNIVKNVEQYISVDNVKYRIVDSFEVKYRIVDSFEKEKSSVAEKDNEHVFMSATEVGWTKAVADGSFGLKIIDSIGKLILRGFEGFKRANEEFYKQAVAEDGIEIFKLFDKVIRHSRTSSYVISESFATTTSQIINSLNESGRIISYKEAELSKERTDLIQFEYKILGATKAENKEHLLDLKHYVFLRALDLEEIKKEKETILEKYSIERNEKMKEFTKVYPNGIHTIAEAAAYGLMTGEQQALSYNAKKNENRKIKEMEANISTATTIIKTLEKRISMQEKYEELEEILSN